MLHWSGCAWHQAYSCGVMYAASPKYWTPEIRSLALTRIRCESWLWAWPSWSFEVASPFSSTPPGKLPVKGLTHARDPMLFWSPFRPETYGSEQPGHRWEPVAQPLVLQLPQTVSSSAKNVCFTHDCPICSKRSVLSEPPLIR